MLGPDDRQMLPRVRRRILDGFGEDSPVASPLPEKPLLGGRGPISGNTGIGGGVTRQIEPPVTPMPGVSDAPAPDPSQPAPMRKMPAPMRKPGNDGPVSRLIDSDQGPTVGIPRGEELRPDFGSDGWMQSIMEVANEMMGRAPEAEQAAEAPESAPSPTSALAGRYPSIVKAYQQSLGRMPSDAEIMSQTGNGSFRDNDPRLALSVQNINGSEEAASYAPERSGAPAPAGVDDGAATDITDIGGAAAAPGGTMRDVLNGAIKSGLGTIRAAQGEDARKAAAEQVIRSVLPQLEAMGVAVEDVRNEKIKIGGVWYDLLRDIEGDAAPQFLALGANENSPAQGAPGGLTPPRGMEPAQVSLMDQIQRTIMQLMAPAQR